MRSRIARSVSRRAFVLETAIASAGLAVAGNLLGNVPEAGGAGSADRPPKGREAPLKKGQTFNE